MQAIEWLVERTPDQVMQQREDMMATLEHASRLMHESGKCVDWFRNSDAKIKRVASGVNGPMLEQLLKGSQYCDCDCANLLREGMSLH